MTLGPTSNLEDLGRKHPEWKPWLSVIATVCRETENPKWDTFVPGTIDPPNKVPALAGATVIVDVEEIRSWIQGIIRIAAQSGAPRMTTMKRLTSARFNEAALFRASVCYDIQQIAELANPLDIDADALQAVGAVIAMPFLHACNRRLSPAQAHSWTEGFCPICGGWPAFAEMRGIERSRYSRCGRCAAEWQVHCLSCTYCGNTDHNELISLRPENSSSTWVIDACNRCLGYLKSFTTLQATPAARIILDDLASVEFDVAALEQGYRRPQGTGYSIDVQVVEQRRSNGRFFSWPR